MEAFRTFDHDGSGVLEIKQLRLMLQVFARIDCFASAIANHQTHLSCKKHLKAEVAPLTRCSSKSDVVERLPPVVESDLHSLLTCNLEGSGPSFSFA